MAGKQKKEAKTVKINENTKTIDINKNTKTIKVNKNMTFADVLTKYPESWEVMQNCGLHCIGCHGAAFETIEQGSLMHGMSEKDVDKMVDDINKKIGGSGSTNTKKKETVKRK